MKEFYKLVRDNIPDIIKQNNEEPITRILDDKEYLDQLNIKLTEEVKEYLDSGEIEELADIMEVILAIAKSKDVSYEQLEAIRKEKVLKRGAFDKKIFLEKTLNK
mgnify:CR=1 FL=1